VTSKVVSKSEGRVVSAPRDRAVTEETDRVLAHRGATRIVRTRHGLVIAAAGVDVSNTAPGTAVLLPVDPDLSARRLRERVAELGGIDVGVVVSDTSGRAWRNGQTDIAIGAAGLGVLDDHAGRVDPYGNSLVVTAPAVADELAAAGDLVKGKLTMSPVAVISGLDHLLLPRGRHGPGAVALVREEASDMFGYGAREAVLHALDPDGDGRGFGAPATAAEVAAAIQELAGNAVQVEIGPDRVTVALPGLTPRVAGSLEARTDAVGRAHGWHATWNSSGDLAVLSPGTP
jgi:coenzyme F420-0:L-glutamate ligase/coenzyme F420-1:gamma-L-glutamate ligase